MKFQLVTTFLAVCLLGLSIEPASGQRIYVRHRRSIEREGVPSKESTVVVASDSKSEESAAADLPDDMKTHVNKSESDCKDFFEMDYNPRRDMFMFNGHLPNPFRPFGTPSNESQDGVDTVQNMFHQMLQQAAQMFNRFPMNNTPMINQNFPDNYNGTTEEKVDVAGKKYIKKQHVVNKNLDGIQVHVISTTYEQVKDDNDQSEETTTPQQTDKKDTSGVEKEAPKKDKKNKKKFNDLSDGTVVQY